MRGVMNLHRVVYCLIAVCVLLSLGTGNAIAQTPPPERPSTLVESVEERYERWVEGYERMPVSEKFQSAEENYGRQPADIDPGTMGIVGRWSNYVFASYRDYNWEIYGRDGYAFSGLESRRLTNHSSIDTRPKARPGANEFVFESNRTSNYGLWLADFSGNILRQLTHQTGSEGQATWSPDGNKLAFVADVYGNSDIFVMNADGSNQVRLTTSPSADFNPCWSPDGSKIIWVRALDSQNGGLFIMNSDGSSQQLLISPLRYLGHPTWSPDGTMILLDYDFNSDGWSDLGYYNLAENHVYVLRQGSYLIDYISGDWTRQPQDAILYTKIWYVVYDNTLYIEYASIGSVRFPDMYGGEDGDLDFYPDTAVQDVLPPVTQVSPMPRYTKINTENYRLTGYDPGVSLFDRVYRCRRTSDEVDWDCESSINYLDTDTIDFLNQNWGDVGKTYYFASRGMDQAANLEQIPSGSGDASTTFYQEDLYGKVIDNRGYPVPFASVTTTPVIDDQVDADPYGRFHRYVPAGYVAPSISKAGFADFGTFTSASLSNIQNHTWALPPLDDVIVNGGFDQNTASWILSFAGIQSYYNTFSGSYLEIARPSLRNSDYFEFHTAKDSTTPQLTVDGLGTLHAVWVDSTTDNVAKIYYSQKAPTGSWSIPAPIFVQTLLSSSEPNLVIGSDGLPHVIWLISTPQNNGQIVHSTRAADGTWSIVVALTDEFALAAGGKAKPRFAVGPDNTLHVTYNTANGGYYLNGVIGGTWSTPTLLTQDQYPQDIQIGADGTLHLVSGTVASGLQYSSRSVAGVWSDLEVVSPMPVTDAHLELDSLDNSHVAWLNADGQIYFTVRSSDGQWSEPALVSLDSPVVDMDFDMSNDQAHVIWLDGTAIRYRRQFEGDGWSSIINLVKKGLTTGVIYPGLSLFVQGDQSNMLWDWYLYSWYGTDINYLTWSMPSEINSKVSQTLTIPADQHLPTLSFFFSTRTDYVEDTTPCELQVEINKTPVYSTIGTNIWKHIWLDMSAWAGQTITIDFVNQPDVKPCFTSALIDEVSLGSFLTPVVESVSPSDPIEEDTPTTIVISGWNFIEAPQVVVGGVAANVQFIDEHTLQVNVPGMTFGMHDIRVINPGGQEAFAGFYKVGKFVYLPVIRR